MIVKNLGKLDDRYAVASAEGTTLHLLVDSQIISFDLSTLQGDGEVSFDVVGDENHKISVFGKYYIANIEIPPKEYYYAEDKENPIVDEETGAISYPVVRVAKPLNMNCVTVNLFPLK